MGLTFDEAIEIIERVRAEREDRRKWYSRIASLLCGRPIAVVFASDCGSSASGAEAIGSSNYDSIAIKGTLDRVTEHCVFCHELVHCYSMHSTGRGLDHSSDLKQFLDLLPEASREKLRGEIEQKEIDADRGGVKLHEAFWPGETWVL